MVLASGLLIGIALVVFPGLVLLVIPAENALMFTSAVYGLARRKRLVQVGGNSYYWLVGVVVIGVVSAAIWAGHMDDASGAAVWPWLGTTATVLTAVFFMAQLRMNVTLGELRARERELIEHRESLERRVSARTSDLEEIGRASCRERV